MGTYFSFGMVECKAIRKGHLLEKAYVIGVKRKMRHDRSFCRSQWNISHRKRPKGFPPEDTKAPL